MSAHKYDLEERLLNFAVRVIAVTEAMNKTRAGSHLADQLLRSGTAAYGLQAEAEGAESRADFIHKLSICYKELREARRWLRLVQRAGLVAEPKLLNPLIAEVDELVRIFAVSVRTAKRNPKTNT